MTQHRQWHMLLLVSLESEDHWRRDDSLWRISGSAWKSELMGNASIGCHYADDIQRSHRKTGCTNLHDQEVTCFNICLLIVPCRRNGLCQMPGTVTQKIELQDVPRGWCRTVCPLCQCVSMCRAVTNLRFPRRYRQLKLISLLIQKTHSNYLLMWQTEHMSTSCCYRQSFVNLQSVSYSNFTEMLQDRNEIN